MNDHDVDADLSVAAESVDDRLRRLEEFRDAVRTRDDFGTGWVLRSSLPKVPNIDALPTAAAEHRGRIVVVEGDGATTNDIPYVCRLLSTGSYEWTAWGSAT